MNRLKSLREKCGMKQSELGKLLNVKDAAISKYESGKIPLTDNTLIALSNIFGVSVDYLLGLTDEQQSHTQLEWQYAPVQNRFGTILSKYRTQNNLSNKDFSIMLGISVELECDLESGKYSPSMPIIQKIAEITRYDVDYIIGAQDKTTIPNGKIEFNGILCEAFISESDLHFRSRFEELCLKHDINNDNAKEKLGLTHQEYIDIKFNRMPTLSELLRISYAFNVSIDYLIGRTDSLITTLSSDEIELLLNYRDCEEHYKKNIRQRANELSIISIGESVAAETPLRKTGTDSGK